MNQHNKKSVIWSMILITNILLFNTLNAQSSENYQIIKSVFTQAGAQSQSANYRILDAVGQSAVVCTTLSENYTVYSGFFYGYEFLSTEVNENVTPLLPEKFQLLQNYPNPFNPVTHIEYHLPQAAEVKLTIYDVTGYEVHQLVKGTISAGYHTAMWDGKDVAGMTVASGVYLYRIEIKPIEENQQSYLDIKKMIFMK